MKKYIVKILTQRSGLIDVPICEGDDLQKIQKFLTQEHGQFITISTTQIN